jgi:hypothetical protein
MDHYDKVVPENNRRRTKVSGVLLRRVALIAAAAVLVGAAACAAAPADLDVEVGRSVEVRYDATAVALEPSAVADAIKTAAGVKEEEEEAAAKSEGPRERKTIGVRVQRRGDFIEVRAEVWGTELSEAPLAEAMTKALPALKGAEIKEEHLQGKVRGTLGEKLGRDLFNMDVLDQSDVETARRQVMEQLAAQGVEGKVDVKIEGEGKKRKVMIRVENEDCDPGDGTTAAPEMK